MAEGSLRLLLALVNRDLLKACRQILNEDCGETVAAFDGTQVLTMLSGQSFDIAIIDCDLPRVSHAVLVRRLHDCDIPVIALAKGAINAKMLVERELAESFVSYPFKPQDLTKTIKEVLALRKGNKKFVVAGNEVDVSSFRLGKNIPLTAGEIGVLASLSEDKGVEMEDAVFVASLNHKFSNNKIDARISYVAGKGFILGHEQG